MSTHMGSVQVVGGSKVVALCGAVNRPAVGVCTPQACVQGPIGQWSPLY